MTNGDSVRALIGTFRRPGGAGIYSVELDRRTLKFGQVGIAAQVLDPIYLVFGSEERVLYSVGAIDLETRQGLLVAYEHDANSGRLNEIDRRPTGGAAACHIAFDGSSGTVAAANYLGGSISAIGTDGDGRFAESVQAIQHRGASVNPQRQSGPHPHSVIFDPAGTRAIACDLGTDQLLQYDLSHQSAAPLGSPPVPFACTGGSGPRHLVFHPSGAYVYVVNELSSTITGIGYRQDKGLTSAFGTWSTVPPSWQGMNLPAAIRLSRSGDRLYVSNRGHDSIASFTVDPASGELEPAGFCASGGKVPRDFALTPDGRAMVIAHQESGSVVALSIDGDSGLPAEITDKVDIPGAVAVLFGSVGAGKTA